MEEEYEEYYAKVGEESEENPVYGAAVCTNSLGLGPLLVQIWRATEPQFDQERDCEYIELKTKEYHMIGCDKEEDRSQLLRYRSHFADSTIQFHEEDNPKGVIERVFNTRRPEMSPNISYYSEAEYPHQKFALSCSILASFCFPLLYGFFSATGVMEIVSTRNQPIGALRNFCKSFLELEGSDLYFACFPDLSEIKDYKNEQLYEWLVETCRDLRLPFAQYWVDVDHFHFKMRGQFSSGYRDRKNFPPWCQLRDAGKFVDVRPLAKPLDKASFCSDITLVSITEYPLAHYAKNYGPLACFSLFLVDKYNFHLGRRGLEFFLPGKMDNSSHQTLMSTIWARLKKHFPSYRLGYMLTSEEEEIRGQVLSVQVINSSSYNGPESFEIGQHDSSLNSNSSEEGTTGETSSSIQNEASQPGNTLAAEGEVFVTPALKPSKITKLLENITKEDIEKQFGRPLEDAAKNFGVGISTLKRRCRDVGVSRWKPGKRKVIDDDEPGKTTVPSVMSNQPKTAVAAHASKITVKVTCNTDFVIKFELPCSSGIAELEDKVIERLTMDRKEFSLKYEDEDGDWVLLACDEDVRECINISRSSPKKTIKMMLGPPLSSSVAPNFGSIMIN